MATFIHELFCIVRDDDELINVYINKDNNLFFGNDSQNFFFTLTKEDWDSLKEFADEQFKNVENV